MHGFVRDRRGPFYKEENVETFWAIFQWLMTHQPSFPWSLVLGALTFTLVALLVRGCIRMNRERFNYGEGPWQLPLSIVGLFLLIALSFEVPALEAKEAARNGAQVARYWFHWVSISLGVLASPAYLGLKKAFLLGLWHLPNWWQGTCRVWQAWRTRRAEKREAKRQAREAAAKAKENQPEKVIARNKERVTAFARMVALEPDSVTRTEKAQRLLDELVECFAEIGRLEGQAPLATLTSSSAEAVRQSDGIFPDVQLPQEAVEETERAYARCGIDTNIVAVRQQLIAKHKTRIEEIDLEIQRLPIEYLAELRERTANELREELRQKFPDSLCAQTETPLSRRQQIAQ